jgi:hypothetical protein
MCITGPQLRRPLPQLGVIIWPPLNGFHRQRIRQQESDTPTKNDAADDLVLVCHSPNRITFLIALKFHCIEDWKYGAESRSHDVKSNALDLQQHVTSSRVIAVSSALPERRN